MRYIIPLILIAIAVTGFLMFTKPLYEDITALRAEVGSYNQALDNSHALEKERDKLTSQYNSISKEDIAKLEKLLPDNIDNIRLILEIEKIASPYGMALRDVKYNTTGGESNTGRGGATLSQVAEAGADFRVLEMDFSVSGTYSDFINFTKDLENNLRIIDISSVSFSSDTDTKAGANAVYKYSFKIKTYWLKN